MCKLKLIVKLCTEALVMNSFKFHWPLDDVYVDV